MYKINLINKKKHKKKARILPTIMWTILLAVPIGGAVYIALEYWATEYKITIANSQLNDVEADLQKWHEDIEFLQQANTTIHASNKQLTELAALLERQVQWTSILGDLVDILPEKMIMQELTVSRISKTIRTEKENPFTGKKEKELIERGLCSSLVCQNSDAADQDVKIYIKKLWLSEELGNAVKDIRMTSLQDTKEKGVNGSKYEIECILSPGRSL
ncbi:hypothetical protein STSP2_02781 [Anaerohalosphaera lusitana]|uniref:Fimbrial assembly protein (PilN) n=1 Tax=Anaerohalosphaera lusitana TaxID=1936003 RepID=A0A1U9NPE3_9BACT|nr:hypothetical protein [Anaerohalosphaera lusitana]AQT69588.1 hypothetical protein STSP2_02781 [Anaerohalosphaera lusitana]